MAAAEGKRGKARELEPKWSQSEMRHVLFATGLLALAARLTIYAESGTTSNLISFAVFWLCAAGYVVYLIVE
jgi:hypothetical protein